MRDLQFETSLQAAARQAYFYLKDAPDVRGSLIARDLRSALLAENALSEHEARLTKDTPHD